LIPVRSRCSVLRARCAQGEAVAGGWAERRGVLPPTFAVTSVRSALVT
jgi:hypothetical protein